MAAAAGLVGRGGAGHRTQPGGKNALLPAPPTTGCESHALSEHSSPSGKGMTKSWRDRCASDQLATPSHAHSPAHIGRVTPGSQPSQQGDSGAQCTASAPTHVSATWDA